MTTPYPEYEGLLALAEESVRRDGRFIDPVKVRMRHAIYRGPDWETSVLPGDPLPSVLEMHMVLLANGQDIEPPLPAWLAEQRARQQEATARRDAEIAARALALDTAWTALWQALPQPITVAYNYSGGHHYETYLSGADHIILTEDLVRGRLKRFKGWAICSNPSRSRGQDFPNPDPPDRRRATCKACLRTAAKVAGVELAEILLSASR